MSIHQPSVNEELYSTHSFDSTDSANSTNSTNPSVSATSTNPLFPPLHRKQIFRQPKDAAKSEYSDLLEISEVSDKSEFQGELRCRETYGKIQTKRFSHDPPSLKHCTAKKRWRITQLAYTDPSVLLLREQQDKTAFVSYPHPMAHAKAILSVRFCVLWQCVMCLTKPGVSVRRRILLH